MVRTCVHCQSVNLRRVSRNKVSEYAASMLGFYPYLCGHCWRVSLYFRKRHAFAPIFMLAALVGFCLFVLYASFGSNVGRVKAKQSPASSASVLVKLPQILTNEDIIKLWKTGMRPEVLSGLIRSTPHDFNLTAESLAKLRQNGVDEYIIRTIVKVTIASTPVTSDH
jgi:hypothetical protein